MRERQPINSVICSPKHNLNGFLIIIGPFRTTIIWNLGKFCVRKINTYLLIQMKERLASAFQFLWPKKNPLSNLKWQIIHDLDWSAVSTKMYTPVIRTDILKLSSITRSFRIWSKGTEETNSHNDQKFQREQKKSSPIFKCKTIISVLFCHYIDVF